MRQTATQGMGDQSVALHRLKMKQALTSQKSSDEEILEDAVGGKDGVCRFGQTKLAKGLIEFNGFKEREQHLAACKICSVSHRKFRFQVERSHLRFRFLHNFKEKEFISLTK